MREPDFDKLRDISNRLEEAQTQPDYRAVFDKLAAEAEAECGDHLEFMEFLVPYTPTKNGEAPLPLHWKRLEEQREQNVPAA